MKTNFISIVIPVYNRDDFIEDCIKSALDQSYGNYEIIIVDNCSNDKTWEIIKTYEKTSNLIRAFRNDHNIGPVQNWKLGISYAKGEYIKIMFSDDLLFRNCLKSMMDEFDVEDAFVVSAARVGNSLKKSYIRYNFNTFCLKIF